MEEQAVTYLETYRGCPFSCTFCEWGATKDSKAVFSVDYITRELEAYARLKTSTVFLVDAGLNLNHQASATCAKPKPRRFGTWRYGRSRRAGRKAVESFSTSGSVGLQPTPR